MASTRDSFAAFLRTAMDNAGLSVKDIEDKTDRAVKSATLYRWLRADGVDEGELSVRSLRATAAVLRVPFLEMLAAAGVLTPIEAGLEDDPTPPEPAPTVEDQIRADRTLSPERQEVLIKLYTELREEVAAGRGRSAARRPE